MPEIYKNVAVWDAKSKSARMCDVSTCGEIISAVRPAGTLSADCAACFDGRGHTALIPGFVNAHGHPAMTLLRGLGEESLLMDWLRKKIWPAEEKLTEDMVYKGTMLAALEMLSTGTAIFADLYFFMDGVARAAIDSGMKAGLSRGIVDSGKDYRVKLDENIDFAKKYNGAEGRITVQLGPHAPYTVSMELMKDVARAAKENDLAVQLHWLETKNERATVQAFKTMTPEEYLSYTGLTDTKHLSLAHFVWVDEKDYKFYARDNITVVHNPKSNWKLGSGTAHIAAALRAGVRAAMGTDGAASNNRLDMWDEMRFAAISQKNASGEPTAIEACDILAMATYNGAVALGFENTGLAREGYAADFILIDLDRPHYVGWNLENLAGCLVYAGSSADIISTVVNGETLYNMGEFPKLDSRKVIAEASQARKEITE
ncbi:MAG: amidohydrolase [Synergistes sp.]|nr:amidohydrolase [Synergistes sp.]